MYNDLEGGDFMLIVSNEKIVWNFGGTTISTDVEIEEHCFSTRNETWITFNPVIINEQQSITLGRFNFPIHENKTLDEHVLDAIVHELYLSYDFIDDYPHLDNFQSSEKYQYTDMGYDTYIRRYNKCFKLREVITRDWLDSIIVMKKLEE